jgi:hypothetical protein
MAPDEDCLGDVRAFPAIIQGQWRDGNSISQRRYLNLPAILYRNRHGFVAKPYCPNARASPRPLGVFKN